MSESQLAPARYDTAITADPDVPAIRIERVFDATPEQLFRAHTEPELVTQWLGPIDLEMEVVTWDCRTGGEYRYIQRRTGESGVEEYGFHGCFHEVGPTRLVQTFTFEGWPEGVALETMSFDDLGDGRTKLTAFSLAGSFVERDQMLASGMDTGVTQGYQRLDGLITAGAL
jgi:uncharacterized protein YndB with AHSA1/START domain